MLVFLSSVCSVLYLYFLEKGLVKPLIKHIIYVCLPSTVSLKCPGAVRLAVEE